MKLRTTALALALTLSVSLLSACGGSDAPAQSTDTSAPSVSAPAESTPDVSAPAESSPDVSAPEAVEPEAPEAVEPEAVEPEAPEAAEPEAPEATEPEAPEAVEPEAPEAVEPDAPAASDVDLMAFVQSLATQYGENFPANANVVEFGMHNDLYPGIADIATEQLVIFQPMMGAVVCEVALAEVTNASDIEAVKAIFQARIDTQVDGGAWYPESIEGWENNSRIVTNGNHVMMIAWSYCDEAVSAFNDLF